MNIRKIAGYKSVQVGYVGRKNGDSNVSEGVPRITVLRIAQDNAINVLIEAGRGAEPE